ncbi:histidinol-phosphatase [Clostridium sp. 'deep sea']|uniref:histidinol-phosphatase n=1 Tax=Clostridium sp. 'deep sea' TaxID=2779445 RepID=UPI0018969845|nr:histidinol-phosphatase [Clostridium sp. 'deep sea']QOR36579.1 histidinol-phosphatase [Clostridium sp. 'deep sea']
MIDYHVHLERGPYSAEWLNEFLTVGENLGISQFGIVEHLYMFKEAKGLLFQDEHVKAKQNRVMQDYLSFINTMIQQGKPIKLGFEVDYVINKENLIREFVKDLPVDFLIGSVHYLNDWSFDTNPNWQNRDILEVYQQYFKTLLANVKSGIFDILGHCGNIAYHKHRLSIKQEEKMYSNFIEEASKYDIVFEINSGGLYRPAGVVFPNLKYLSLLKECGIEVTVSSDAHDPKHTGYKLNELIIPKLKEVGYKKLVTFTKRKKQYLEI